MSDQCDWLELSSDCLVFLLFGYITIVWIKLSLVIDEEKVVSDVRQPFAR